MQRIYESRALKRDDDDPLTPNDRSGSNRPTAGLSNGEYRTVDWKKLSHAVVPSAVRKRAISVEIETDAVSYDPDTPVQFQVVMRNLAPFPIVLVTETPVRWQWTVDSLPSASEVSDADPPATPKTFTFDRREIKTFDRIWRQRVRTGEHSWRRPEPGEHTIGAAINVVDADEAGLMAETTIEIR